jgi:hypothetical protein
VARSGPSSAGPALKGAVPAHGQGLAHTGLVGKRDIRRHKSVQHLPKASTSDLPAENDLIPAAGAAVGRFSCR